MGGRITPDILKQTLMDNGMPQDSLKCLAVGTTEMVNFAYGALGQLGLDISMDAFWRGSNLLYRKLAEASAVCDRHPSPLLSESSDGTQQAPAQPQGKSGSPDERSSKRMKM